MIEFALSEVLKNPQFTTLKANVDYDFSIILVESPTLEGKLLITDGLSKHPQSVTEKFAAFKRIELYFYLPGFFDLDLEKWPLTWLNKLAELPQKNETWYGPGDTIPAGNPPQLLSDRFPANHFMLTEPLALKDLFSDTQLQKENIQLMGIVPVSQLEIDYKLRNSATMLVHRLTKKGHSEKVDLFRQEVCRKRILGLF